ncbi:hypothetical protein TYRP_017286 [Tyrophagus putrescentiae]|nr:hypothetical protein TYRP_017286 [Tyrophagus putrescentiae]
MFVSGAQIKTARSGVTWLTKTPADEGLASGASEVRVGGRFGGPCDARSLKSQLSLLTNNVALMVFIHAGSLVATVYLAFTMATFSRLRVINGLLGLPKGLKKQGSQSMLLPPLLLNSFYRLHTATLVTITRVNVICGRVMLAVMVVFPPANAFITMSLTLGKLQPQVVPLFAVWLVGQLGGQFAVHWISAQYTVHLHSHTRRLLSLGCGGGRALGKHCLISRLKHAHYIAKYLVVRRYGITYGCISLISINSFGKHNDCICTLKQCTAQGGEVWHLLATVNFRCLGSRERSERGPRRRKFTVAKRCRHASNSRAKRAGPEETEVNSGQVTSEIRDKSSRKNLAMHNTWRRGLAPLVHFKLPLPRVPRAKRAGPEAAEV